MAFLSDARQPEVEVLQSPALISAVHIIRQVISPKEKIGGELPGR